MVATTGGAETGGRAVAQLAAETGNAKSDTTVKKRSEGIMEGSPVGKFPRLRLTDLRGRRKFPRSQHPRVQPPEW
jgi:hypothetical protein